MMVLPIPSAIKMPAMGSSSRHPGRCVCRPGLMVNRTRAITARVAPAACTGLGRSPHNRMPAETGINTASRTIAEVTEMPFRLMRAG